MTSLSLFVVLQAATLAAGSETYAEAHKTVAETGQPMLVYVGAEWCPACRVMKTQVLPQVRQSGLLEKVAFATVDLDEEQELGQELVGGGMIPQLLMYRQTPAGWRLRRLVGGQSTDAVEAFIHRGIELDELAKSGGPAPKTYTASMTRETEPAVAAAPKFR